MNFKFPAARLEFKFSALACVSQKTRKLYGPEKPFVKLRPAYSVKLVFLYVVKGIKIKITAKFCDTEHFRFEDTKRIMSPKLRETGPRSQQKTKSFCKIIVGIGCGKRTRITLGEDKWLNHHKAMLE